MAEAKTRTPSEATLRTRAYGRVARLLETIVKVEERLLALHRELDEAEKALAELEAKP
jgi:hypothetical protein